MAIVAPGIGNIIWAVVDRIIENQSIEKLHAYLDEELVKHAVTADDHIICHTALLKAVKKQLCGKESVSDS